MENKREVQPPFTNHTTLDGATCRDFLALSWPRNAGATRWVLAGVAVVAAGWGAGQLWLEGLPALPYAAALFFMAAAALFLAFWGWVLRIKKYTAAQRRAWGAPTLDKTVYFYDGYFEQQSALGTLRFSYGRISRVRKNRRCLLLDMGSSAMLLRRDGLEPADEAALLAFVAARGRAGAGALEKDRQ